MALETTSGLLWPGAGPFGGERLSAIDVLALAGENPDAIREGVRVAFADCEEIFRAQETNKRMRDNAALVCRALCRARVVAEMHQRRGTRIAEHLNLMLSIIDRQVQ